jgi:hypothetical protein
MIQPKLKSRLKFIKATPLPDRAITATKSRRDNNFVIMDQKDDEGQKYDTFFDYENDLADLKPSREQYSEHANEEPYVVLEDAEVEAVSSPITMEASPESPIMAVNNSVENEASKNKYTDVVGFQFIQCSFVKDDGNRCKRQAPKGAEICTPHRKMIKKNS